jgi:hypothetical protein
MPHKDDIIEAKLEGRNVSKDEAQSKIRGRYYDVTNTITRATPNDPGDADAAAYQQELIYDTLQQRASIIRVVNDGTNTLFVRVSHNPNTFSPENPVFAGDIKEYYNVYELRLRSPTEGLPYRVTEYNVRRSCCPDISVVPSPVTIAQLTPIVKASLHNQALPAINTNFLGANIVPTNPPCAFAIEVAISVAGILSATVTSGGNTQVASLNAGIALTAGALYIFEVIVHSGDSVNLRYNATAGNIQILRIQEVDSAVI